MLIQIYEIQDAKEAQDVAALGVNHIGILVGDGEFPREIAAEDAEKILHVVPKTSKRTVLTLSDDPTQIAIIVEKLCPDILHLGTLPEAIVPDDVRVLKEKFPAIKVMRSIPVTGENSIALAKEYDAVADFLLLDTHLPQDVQIGATGMTHDWQISKRIVQSVKIPVILAGGLGPDNVAEAIRIVQPAGVDSKTKTDQAGSHKKDLKKIKEFVDAIRGRRH